MRAQHTRLQALQDELARLRELKTRLETARAQGDQELAAWVLEDQQFQNLVAQVSIYYLSCHYIDTILVVMESLYFSFLGGERVDEYGKMWVIRCKCQR